MWQKITDYSGETLMAARRADLYLLRTRTAYRGTYIRYVCDRDIVVAFSVDAVQTVVVLLNK